MTVLVADVKQRVADALKVPGVSDLATWWNGICTAALASAEADVQGVLVGRGYTVDQVDDWPGGVATVSDLALFWALTNAGVLEAFDDKFVKALDRREQLKTVVLTDASGALVRSAAIGHGPLKYKEGVDTFTDDQGKFKKW